MASSEKNTLVNESFEKAISRDPDDFLPYFNMGCWCKHETLEYAEAMQYFNTALELEPNAPGVLEARASLFAMCPDAAIRDGDAALRDAKRAIEIARSNGLDRGWRERQYLETLAAAYAEVNDFEKAIEIQLEALALAITKRNREPLQSRLELYESGIAVRLTRRILKLGPWSSH